MGKTTIYKKDTLGKIRYITLDVRGGEIYQCSGVMGSSKSLTTIRKCKAKNVGKANETTPNEQAKIELQSILNRKLREGHFQTEEEARNNTVLLPMLAKSANITAIKFPIFMQPKLDGIRAVFDGTRLMSRKNKEIDTMSHIVDVLPKGVTFDGELYLHEASFQDNMKLIKKISKDNIKVKYHIYDMPTFSGGYSDRSNELFRIHTKLADFSCIEFVETLVVSTVDELKKVHQDFLNKGYEGSIIRLDGFKYEYNKRSNSLLKYKDFIDETYKIVNVLPSDKIPSHGTIVCEISSGKTFKCGMKVSHSDREEILTNKEYYIGKTAEVRFFEYTDGGLPRFPIFHGVRLDK